MNSKIIMTFITSLFLLSNNLFADADGKSYLGKPTTNNILGASDRDFSRENLFTGDVAFPITIGSIGGVEVTLNYNSNVHKLVHANNAIKKGEWVGLGWTLTLGSITADINGTRDVTDDRYIYVDANGSSELILEKENSFKLKNYKFWELTRHLDTDGNIIGWTIKREDGRIFRYGNYDKDEKTFKLDFEPTNATRFSLGWGNFISDPIYTFYSSATLIAYQWDLSDIEDIHGNHTIINYQQETENLSYNDGNTLYSTPVPYTRASYPKSIVDPSGNKIEFKLDILSPMEYEASSTLFSRQQYYEKQYLKEILIRNYNNEILWKFVFDYKKADVLSIDQTKRYLTKITRKNATEENDFYSWTFKYFNVDGVTSGENIGALQSIIYPSGKKVIYNYKYQTLSNISLEETNQFSSTLYPPMEIDLLNSGLSGSDFKVIKMNDESIRVYRWGTKGWYYDNSFPISTTEKVEKYWVHNDYIIVKLLSKLSILKRKDNYWSRYNITLTPSLSAHVFGRGNDYFVFSKDIHLGNQLYYGRISVATFKNNKWDIQEDIFGAEIGLPTNLDDFKVQCGNKFFVIKHGYGQNICSVFSFNGEEWITTKDSFNPVNEASTFKLYAGSDYFISYDFDYKMLRIWRWNGLDWGNPKEFSESAEGGIYTSNNYFVTYDEGKILIYIKTADGWEMHDASDHFDVVSSSNGFNHARIAPGSRIIAIGWFNDSNDGYAGIIKIKNDNSLSTGILMYTYEDMGDESFVSPISNNEYVFWEFWRKEKYHKIKHFFRKVGGTILETNLVDVTFSSMLNNESKSFSNPGSNFFADIVDPSQVFGNELSHSFMHGYKENFLPLFKGNPGDYPINSKTIIDGRGDSTIITYKFENGTYDAGINFTKYNKVTVIYPGTGKTITYFYNDLNADDCEEFVEIDNDPPKFLELDGMPYLIKTFDEQGNIISEKKNKWQVIDKGDSCYYRYLKKTKKTDLNKISVTSEFEYNMDNGQKSKEILYEPNSETDIRLVKEYTYDTDSRLTDKHIINWPSRITIKDANDKRLKETEFVYDYNDLYLKQKKQWLWNDKNGDGNVDSDEERMIATSSVEAVNDYGQPIHSLDLVNNIPSTTIYSLKNHLPIATITNAEPDEVVVDHFDHTDIFNSETGQWYVTNNDRNNWEVRYGKLIWNNTDVSLEDCSINRAIDQTNFIAEFDVRVAEALVSGGDWAGFHFRKTSIDHQVSSSGSSGYLVFLRRNGIVELDKIHPDNGITMLGDRYELANRNGDWNYVHGGEHHIRVVAEGSNIKVYVDGVLAIDVTDSDFSGSYCGFSTYRTKSMFDNIRIYPSDAYCTSRSYDSKTLQVKEEIDADGLITRYYYDDFYRLVQIRDKYYNILQEKNYYLSKEENTEYLESDPNFVRVIEYNSKLINGKHSNLISDWSFDLDHVSQGKLPLFWKLGSGNLDGISIVRDENSKKQCLKLDQNYSEYSTQSYFVSDPDGNSEKLFQVDHVQTKELRGIFSVAGDVYLYENDIVVGHVYPDQTTQIVDLDDVTATYKIKAVAGSLHGEQGSAEGWITIETGEKTISLLSEFIEIDPNSNYYISALVKTTGSANAFIKIKWYDILRQEIGIETVATGIDTTIWASYGKNNIISPSNACFARIYIGNEGDEDCNAYFDDILFIKGNESIQLQQSIVTTYLDGLGREFQTQSIKYSPADNHYKLVITGKEYDEMGRPYRSWLPIEIDQYNLPADHGLLSFISDYQSRVHAEYDTDADYTAWYETVYTNDLTNRVVTTYGPGDDYNYQGTRHITTSYGVNTADDNVYDYPDAGTVYKTTSMDNTYGPRKIVNVSFKDAFGNTVETVQDKDSLDYHTIYRYDVQNRLISTFAPQGYEIYEDEKQEEYKEIIVHPQNLIAADVGSQIYLQSIPATDSTKVVKVKMYFIANTIDAEPRVDYTVEYYLNGWQNLGSFTLADSGSQGIQVLDHTIPQDAGMVRVTIDYIEPVDKIDRAQTYSDYTIEASVGYQQIAVLDDFESTFKYNTLDQLISERHPDDGLGGEGLTEYKYDLHGNLRFKRDAKSKSDTIMVYYRYDSLDRTIEIGICADKYFTQEKAESEIPDSVLNPQVKYVYDLKSPDVYGQKHLRGRLSYKAYKNHGDWDYTYYSYTRDGKIEWIEHHIQGLRKRIEYEYDLAGNIVKISYDRNGPDQLFYWYEYGPTGSLISVYTNTTDDRATAQKEITYLATDQFGNQTQIILGYNVQAVDTIEYVYDIWNNLLSINDVNDLGNDKFAMKLFYNSNDFEQKYYNGLISGIELHYPAISGVNENRYRYGFEYDPLNRLKNAQHYWPEYEGPENPGVISAWIGDEKYKVNNLLYDANGNIKSLRRNNDNGTILNDLQYSYATNTNKLTSVTDGSLTKTFGYDASGNVIKYNAGNDHLYEIEYNFRNLPIQIQTTGPDGEPLFYYYAYDDGAGRIYDKEDNLITAYYIRGADGQVMAEYNYQKNLVLWRMGGFGYKTPDGNSYYYLKDHIGNIRVTVNEQGEIVTKDDYYPFGLRMPGLSYNNGNQNDRLKFQSKKLQDYGNWRTYYFGWRDYDPELGRWFVVDPARQFASPYVYGGNNPIIGYEPDGRIWWLAGLFSATLNAMTAIANGGDGWDIIHAATIGFITGSISYGITYAGAMSAGTITASKASELATNHVIAESWTNFLFGNQYIQEALDTGNKVGNAIVNVFASTILQGVIEAGLNNNSDIVFKKELEEPDPDKLNEWAEKNGLKEEFEAMRNKKIFNQSEPNFNDHYWGDNRIVLGMYDKKGNFLNAAVQTSTMDYPISTHFGTIKIPVYHGSAIRKGVTRYKGFIANHTYLINGTCHQDVARILGGVSHVQAMGATFQTLVSMGIYGSVGGPGRIFYWAGNQYLRNNLYSY